LPSCLFRLIPAPFSIDQGKRGLLMTEDGALSGGVPLAAAIRALRAELTQAWTDAHDESLRFKVAPVELTLEAAVTWTGTGTGGIKWWLLEAGGEVSREKTVTQTIKLTLDPVTLDAQGNVVSIFIDDEDITDGSGKAGSVTLDDDD
jgi:hypothetical protein